MYYFVFGPRRAHLPLVIVEMEGRDIWTGGTGMKGGNSPMRSNITAAGCAIALRAGRQFGRPTWGENTTLIT